MSLLMDALRKAEQVKKQAASAEAETPPSHRKSEPRDEQVLPESPLSLERSDPGDKASGGVDAPKVEDLPESTKTDQIATTQAEAGHVGDGTTEGELEGVGYPENVLVLDDVVVKPPGALDGAKKSDGVADTSSKEEIIGPPSGTDKVSASEAEHVLVLDELVVEPQGALDEAVKSDRVPNVSPGEENHVDPPHADEMSASELENVLVLDDVEVEPPGVLELTGDSDPEVDISTEEDLPDAPTAADTSSPASISKSENEAPEPREVSADPKDAASVASSRQTAATLFTAKKEYQRRRRNHRLIILLTVAGLLLFTLAVFFFFTYRSMNNSVLPSTVIEKDISEAGVEPESLGAAGDTRVLPAGSGVGELEDGGADLSAGLVPEDLESLPQLSPEPREESLALGNTDSYPLSGGHALPPATSVSLSSTVVSSLASPSLEKDQLDAEKETARVDLGKGSEVETKSSSPEAIVITRRAAELHVGPLLEAAYRAYQQDDFKEAQRNYQQVIQSDPQNRGALQGLAAIAMHRQENSLARDLYRRLLDLDPGDPLARAGLLAIDPEGDLVQQESELKLLLELHPNSAPLHFSLGNLYASGQRWNEAQQAYFNALGTAKIGVSAERSFSSSRTSDTEIDTRRKAQAPSTSCVNPDYPFNLAVSLEHLGKLKLAANYYREALRCSADQPAGFDAESLLARIKTLEQGEAP